MVGLLVMVWRPAHPRVGGEDIITEFVDAHPRGFPPRRRGRLRLTRSGAESTRLTPA